MSRVRCINCSCALDDGPPSAVVIVDARGPDAISTAIASGEDLEDGPRDLDLAVSTGRRVVTAPGA